MIDCLLECLIDLLIEWLYLIPRESDDYPPVLKSEPPSLVTIDETKPAEVNGNLLTPLNGNINHAFEKNLGESCSD